MAVSKTKKTTILIPQQDSSATQAPYHALAEQYNLDIDFKPFLMTEPIKVASFRKYKPEIIKATAFIFTSKRSIDYFFTSADACSIKLSADTKYFCTSKLLTHYLQKYIILRKRKAFHSCTGNAGMLDLFKKHKGDRFLLPCSNFGRPDVENFFAQNEKMKFAKIEVYRTLFADLSNLKVKNYDIICLFIPLEVRAFVDQFPDFVPEKTRFAAFGSNTRNELAQYGWESIVHVPTIRTTSMADALDHYFRKEERLRNKEEGNSLG